MEYDELLAAAYFIKDFDNPNRVFLYSIIVDPKESGKHIGESLLMSAFSDLKESNLRMVEVTVHPSNYKALRIYKDELGFNIINAGDDANIDDGDEDFLILRKSL